MMENQIIEILIVEDNPNDAELEFRAFKKYNLANQVFVVKDGAEALDYLFSTGKYIDRKNYVRPKVVFLDLKLPKISGLEVLRKIRSSEETMTLPVVILTSSTEERDLIEGYSLGVNSYIVKPIDFSKFIQIAGELGFYWVVLNKPPVL